MNEENTPLKQKYDKNSSDLELKAAVFPKKTKENKENLEEKNPPKPTKLKKMKNIEESIKENENLLDISKNLMKKSSCKKSRNMSNNTPKSRNDSPKPLDISGQKSNMPETILLNKKIMMLKKNLEEERGGLGKEKQKNKELKEEIERLNRRIKKMEIKNEKNSQLECDYLKLMESFEKSETIRKQQKLLIANLKKTSKK